jgi:hypothetical protein
MDHDPKPLELRSLGASGANRGLLYLDIEPEGSLEDQAERRAVPLATR